MVLAELGGRITKALSAMTEKVIIDEAAVDELIKEIVRALIEADVNIKLVMNLRDNIKKSVAPEQLAAGTNKRRLLQRVVFDELCNMLDCKTQPYKPKRGQPNVLMFVGLQGAGKTTTVAKIAHFYQVGYCSHLHPFSY
jgi:signal recognition particle subunit SRP54